MKHSAPSAAVISDLCVARCCFVLNQGASPSEQQRRSRFISCLKEIPKPCWQNRRKIRTLISLGNKGRRPSYRAISKGLSRCRLEAGQNSPSKAKSGEQAKFQMAAGRRQALLGGPPEIPPPPVFFRTSPRPAAKHSRNMQMPPSKDERHRRISATPEPGGSFSPALGRPRKPPRTPPDSADSNTDP